MAMNINDSFRYMQDYRINDIPRVDIDRAAPAPVQEPAPAEEATPA